jgi:hypothetical protein
MSGFNSKLRPLARVAVAVELEEWLDIFMTVHFGYSLRMWGRGRILFRSNFFICLALLRKDMGHGCGDTRPSLLMIVCVADQEMDYV